jgi:NAD(P)-dependent dehydrogenase (short-subunit alcohol dehydrogenase family)
MRKSLNTTAAIMSCNSGIGPAIAIFFAKEGSSPAITGRDQTSAGTGNGVIGLRVICPFLNV